MALVAKAATALGQSARWCRPLAPSFRSKVVAEPFLLHHRSRSFAAAAAGAAPRILVSDVQDILFHFAVEEYLMQNAEVTAPLMYLWRPAPVVTIGRHQNPWKECILERLEADNVGLVRRRSGGGAVFQDPGCTVFTFIAPSDSFSIDKNFEIVLGALDRVGVKAEKSGRNDMTYQGKKISGSAFKHAPDRGVSLHHGTVLVETDFQALSRYLTPDKRKLEAKGIKSVAARVMNLRDEFPTLQHSSLCDAFIAEFREQASAQGAVIEQVTESTDFTLEAAFKAHRAEQEDKEWRLGRTPTFSHHLETRIDGVGVFDVRLDVAAGKVREAVIFSDALYPDVIDRAMTALTGAEYGREGLRAALDSVAPALTEEGPQKCLAALRDWVASEVEH
eukprot:TRINITY_DN123446_c0_g1_i1.p1 TRINITY_DN123446_c0_g1~~TRINITY_DN123446_c0_g1_i1.p1  ORF type:complete len:391 (+),score=71.65 TRINITY_DN123446_c0_g1_i1:42-1214(+)